MTMMKGKRRLLQLLGLSLAGALTGLETSVLWAEEAGLSVAEREALLARVREYWAAAKANQRLKTWSFEKQSLDAPESVQAYVGRQGLAIDAAEVGTLTVKTRNEVEVDVRVTASLPTIALKGYVSRLKDQWVRVEGVWYHIRPESAIYKTN